MTEQINIEVHREDGYIWAQVKEYPGCFASGADMDELTEALEEALGMVLEDRPGSCKVTLKILPAEPARRERLRAHLIPA